MYYWWLDGGYLPRLVPPLFLYFYLYTNVSCDRSYWPHPNHFVNLRRLVRHSRRMVFRNILPPPPSHIPPLPPNPPLRSHHPRPLCPRIPPPSGVLPLLSRVTVHVQVPMDVASPTPLRTHLHLQGH